MNELKSLVVFYSRTGRTRELANRIQASLKVKVGKIYDTKNRAGSLGYLKCPLDVALNRLAVIEEPKSDLGLYDIVIVGTSVWVGTTSTLIRTFLSRRGGTIKKAAFFCTCDSGSNGDAFKDMENLYRRKPIAVLELRNDEVSDDRCVDRTAKFIEDIRKAI